MYIVTSAYTVYPTCIKWFHQHQIMYRSRLHYIELLESGSSGGRPGCKSWEVMLLNLFYCVLHLCSGKLFQLLSVVWSAIQIKSNWFIDWFTQLMFSAGFLWTYSWASIFIQWLVFHSWAFWKSCPSLTRGLVECILESWMRQAGGFIISWRQYKHNYYLACCIIELQH